MFKTLYLGGGTPSLLDLKALKKLFDGLWKRIEKKSLREINLESNPATFDLQKAQLFKELGISRVSVGVQSFCPKLLKILGRDHTKEQAIQAIEYLKASGIPSINIDLMFSLPEQSQSAWEESLDYAINLEVNHISAYNLTYETGTVFYQKWKQGIFQQQDSTNADFFLLAHDKLTTAGFEHYETSNYAKPHFQSLHNQGYWEGMDYLGIGPSAVTQLNKIRSKNISNTKKYISMIQTLGQAKSEEEFLNESQWKLERIALMLRTQQGLPKSYLIHPKQLQKTEVLIQQSLAVWKNDCLCLTLEGSLLVDEIVVELDS